MNKKLFINRDGRLEGDTSALFSIWQRQRELNLEMDSIPLCG